ncbi:MAG: hypothetical protein ACO3FX_03805, partial [Gemmobacter sp.]
FDYSHFNRCTFDDQTDLTHASFFGANLGGSTLPPQSLANSHGDDGTTLPDGVERPDAWKPPPPTDPTDPPPATS